MPNGQSDSSVWDSFWHGLTPESEIRMWDFYGGRPWVLKHVPRFGKILEAGCGLGRYVFYLTQMGMDVEGLDFHEPTVRAVNQWAQAQGFQCKFRVGDVTGLPYGDESLSGYLSFGVIEHFQEGPSKALAEAFRVLRPGGIAIISTPSISFAQAYFRFRRRAKKTIKQLIGRQIVNDPFFQYWYTPNQLKSFVLNSGLRVVLSGACDLKYAFWELTQNSDRKIFWFSIADFFEKTPLAGLGAQAFTIAVKVNGNMHCFLCGHKNVELSKWKEHYLPVCETCSALPVARFYQKKNKPQFKEKWQYNQNLANKNSLSKSCYFCNKIVQSDNIFEDYGYSVPICHHCLRIPERNLIASNELLQPRWRPRHPKANLQ